MKSFKFKLFVIVFIMLSCALFASINKTKALYRETKSTTIHLSVLDPATNFVVTLVYNDGSGNSRIENRAYNQELGHVAPPARENYNFLGWYDTNNNRVYPDNLITADITLYAHWQEIICKKVTSLSHLHEETCATSGGCLKNGTHFSLNSTITYGTVFGDDSPVAGDAYDCDVNYDGTYDGQSQYGKYTERFYYLREIDNGNQEDTASLIYYTSVDGNGPADTQHASSVGSTTYDAALAWLPTSSTWDNPGLIDFDSNNGKVTRFLTIDDLEAVCGSPMVTDTLSYFTNCGKWFLFENSRFQSESLGRAGIWLEVDNNVYHRIQTTSVNVATVQNTSNNMARPVIEIPVTALEGYKSAERYTITFETHGGTSILSIKRNDGEAIGILEEPTREHFTFDGWYEEYSDGVYTTLVTPSTIVTGDMTLHAKWIPKPTSVVTFNANGGTIDGESTFELTVDTGSTISEDDFPEAIYEGKELDGWFTDSQLTEPFDETEPITANITLYAKWSDSIYVAKVNNVKYETLAEAISNVPTGTSASTTVTILKNITLDASVNIPSDKWVKLDIGNHTIDGNVTLITNNGKLDIINGTMIATNTNSKVNNVYVIGNKSTGTINISGGVLSSTTTIKGDFSVIENAGGEVNITGGRLTCAAQSATINHKSGGLLNVSGGEIISTSTIKGQAIYIEGNSTVNISGNPYIENVSASSGNDARAAVDNNSGTLVITGGTIVSKAYTAVKSRVASATTTIGTDDGVIDITTPVMRGQQYGMEITAGTVGVYDGIFESYVKTQAISTTDVNKPTGINFKTDGTVTIDNESYHTAYLFEPHFTVRFFPENGENTISLTIDNGEAIGTDMPSNPTKTNYYFTGWYDDNTQITSTMVVTKNIDAYARWVQSVSNATMSSTLGVILNNTNQIEFVETDIEDVTYSSSDTTVATVDSDGTVHGVGLGTATITITGTLTGDTRTVTITVSSLMRTVTFLDSDSETELFTRQVADGFSLGINMPSNPTDTNYVFNAWYINGNSATPFTSATVVTGDVTVVADWKEKITYATVSLNSLEMIIGNTEQITLTANNQGDMIENYTFTSGDTNVATVDSNGQVTAVGVGTTNITITGSLSGETIQIPVSVDVLKYTVTFKDGNNVITEIRVQAGTTIDTLMPSNLSKTNYIFDGWFINGDSLYPVTSETVVNGNIVAVAGWTPTIQLATIPSTLNVTIGSTNTIPITDVPTGMEAYTFTSADNQIATVDSNGVVSGVALGTVNITITGVRSNTTKVVEVTVSYLRHTVTFKDDDNSIITTVQVATGNSLDNLMPADLTKTNYIFKGWFIDGNSTIPFTSQTVVNGDMTVIASWRVELNSATITTTPDPLTFKKGKTGQIILTASGIVEDCTFSSSNTNVAEIASISNNNNPAVTTLFGADEGTATITITGVDSGQTRTVSVVIHNLNTITFDPDNGSSETTIQVRDGLSIDSSGETIPADPTKSGYLFDRWYLYDGTALTDTPLDTSIAVTDDIVYKASWASTSSYAAIGRTYYPSIKDAIAAVTTSDETEIRVLQDITNTSGQTIVPDGKNIILVGGNHTVSCGASTTNQLILNQGTLRIKSGTYTCNKSTLAVLENAKDCHMYIDDATVINYNNRGAIYNAGGALVISGGEFTSSSLIRPVVQNATSGASLLMTGGTIIQSVTGDVDTSNGNGGKDNGKGAIKVIGGTSATITGGTVISTASNSPAIYATGGTLTIGTQNNAYDVTKPVIQGEYYGIESNVNYSIYDGIIKGKENSQAVNNESKITGKETGSTKQNGQDDDYYTLYYTLPEVEQGKYHITFNANDGVVSPSEKDFNLNEAITASDLPTPTKGVETFDGWYTDVDLQTPFATFTPTTADTVTYYAKWSYVSSTTPVQHDVLSDAMVDYFNNVGSWVANDATDPSNDPPQEASQSNNYDNGHHLFKDSISSTFNSNGCSPCGADNSCSNPQAGVYCDQPSGFDTGLTDNLNVYLYENGQKSTPVTYTTSTGGKIYNMIPGVTYYWESATDNTKYGVVAATGNRRTLKTSVRNLRDLGGMSVSYEDLDTHQTVTGTIDYGWLYRGAQITSAQGVTDLEKLGIIRELDLRENGEENQTYKMQYYDTGTSSSYVDIIMTNYIVNPTITPFIATAYPTNYANVKNALRKAMEAVVFGHDNVAHDSIFFHCTIGTDRTGTLAYFLEGLLGVSEEDRLRDYELTYFFGLTNRTRFHDSVSWSSIKPRFYSMYRSYPTNADIYSYYTHETHVPDPNNPNDLSDDDLLTAFRNVVIKKSS